ncbi:MAG: DNA-(apurinic or apyrimidinic site) lyase [Acidimicrobiales bacterium]|nr:DNA-(apurinic or apyrimidinic site) lyase [Acidimicrobiales bacterium]
MPELIEVEAYRRLADQAVGRRVVEVDAPDAWFLKRGTTERDLRQVVVGRAIEATRRIGKLLLVDTSDGGPTVGLRFGMTGRLLLDGEGPIDRLEYSSHRDEPAWNRFALRFADGGVLRISDPRRLGGVELEPDTAALGPDALSITEAQLRAALGASVAPLKARLLDQARIAGLGNLLVDEILWRAAIDPARPAGELPSADLRRLHRHIGRTVRLLDRRGGSHTGDLQAERRPGGRCPRDGTELQRRTVGGRTTWSCPTHQG